MTSRAEIAFADEQWRDEDPRRGNFRQHFFDLRFLFPERLAHFAENLPAAQFRRVLEDRRGGIVIQRRAMAEHDQRGIGKIFTVHTPRLAQTTRRPQAAQTGIFYLKLFDGFRRLICKLSAKQTNLPMKTMTKLTARHCLPLSLDLTAAVSRRMTPCRRTPTLPPASTKTGVTYATDIKPIFDATCVKCHDGTRSRGARNLSLDTLAGMLKGGQDGKVIAVGDSAHSDLVMSVAHIGRSRQSFMPKGRNAKTLTPEQIGLIRAWIDQGAK